jgi:hypothetical protein
MSEQEFTTTFDVASLYFTHGTVYHVFPGVQLVPTSSGDANYGGIGIDLEGQGINFNSGKDYMLQFSFNGDSYGGGTFFMKYGWSGSAFEKRGVGLSIASGSAEFWTANYDHSVVNTLAFPTYEDTVNYIIRIQYIAGDNLIYVYINGELLGTMESADTGHQDPGELRFEVKRSGSAGPVLNVLSVFFSNKL